jgi:electron transfer flavoprotein alpha/beta subunit
MLDGQRRTLVCIAEDLLRCDRFLVPCELQLEVKAILIRHDECIADRLPQHLGGHGEVDRRFGGADTYATSYTLAQAVRALGGFDLILCGRQAIDGDTAQVGPMLAEHLGLPQLTCACAITIEDGAIRIRQEGERAYRVLRAPLPAVVTVVKTINEPRLPNVMRKLQANRMQPQTLTADDLPALDPDCIGLHGSPTKVSRTFVPVRTKQTVRIDGAQPEAAVASLLAQLDAAHISLEGGGDHV